MGENQKKGDVVKKSLEDLKKYRYFLETILLDKFRDIKWVEIDLPREMVPDPEGGKRFRFRYLHLAWIFKYYWDERRFLSFDEWFKIYWKEINTKPEIRQVLEKFKKYYFDDADNNWFKKGFKARMWRTWVSVLTQIDFCYMFGYICAKEGKDLRLEANAELDARGIDAKVDNIGFQIGKRSQRKEARTESLVKKEAVVAVPYVVWDPDELKKKIQNPRTRIKNTYQKMVDSFDKYFIKLQNGFVVFNENYLKPIIDNMDNIEAVRKAVKKISLELSGEY